MTRTVEFYFDYVSPWTYMAYNQLPGLIERTGAKLVWKPMFLGGLFKAIGNQPPALLPARGAYMFKDLQRCANYFDIPYKFNPHFPVNTLFLMRATFIAEEDNRLNDFIRMGFESVWAQEKNMGDKETRDAVLMANGFDPDYYEKRAQAPEVKQKLKAVTEEAEQRGAFGAPTFFVGDEMFFGQDRLGFIEAALTR